MFAFSGSTSPSSLNRAVLVSGNLIRAVIRTSLEPVSPYSAAAFRIVFGLLVLVAVVRFAANGWISQLYVDPAYHFSYYGFGWVQPWPAWGMYLHFALLGLASLGVMLGYRYRLSIVAFFLLFTYVQLIDRTTYLNHYYLVSLLSLVMIFLPLNRVASLDSRRRSKGEALPAIPRGVLWLLMAQIGLVYVFGGLAKLNPDWLLHAQPLRIWLYDATDVPVIGSVFREEWMAYAMGWGGVVFDLTIAGWLLWRKTRTWAYGALVLFHLATAMLFPALGMFPWLMIGLTLVFFAPDWPLKLASKMTRRSALPQTSFVAHRQQPGLESRERMASIAVAATAVFLLVQVALPLRHYAYPGNVRWTEEGYLFAWRMMLTEKTGQVVYRVSGLSGPRETLVLPEEYLTPSQAERMSHQPDLILAMAHLIRDDFAQQGYEQVQVHADAYVSYNGRPAARLVDPVTDLAQVRAGPGPREWVLHHSETRR